MSDFKNLSLMDLANVDTSDLTAQMSRLPDAGIYIAEIAKAGFEEQPPKDPADPMNFTCGFNYNILMFQPEAPDYQGNPEDKVGRPLNERYFIYGKEGVQEGIQLLMGRYKKAGFRCKGVMGGVEGKAVGWVDEAIGKAVAVRVVHRTDKEGQPRAYFDWLSLNQLQKADIPWHVFQRPFLDETGNEVEIDEAA